MIISYQEYTGELNRQDAYSYLEECLRTEQTLDNLFSESERRKALDRKLDILWEKPQQMACALPNEQIGLECVQAYISNMSAATSLEELDEMDGVTLPENLMSEPTSEWTAPKWAKAGDISFFMHSKKAGRTIAGLRAKVNRERNTLSVEDFRRYISYLDRAAEIHARYGGKIFAVGRVSGSPKYIGPKDASDDVFHWKSRNYSRIDNIQVLDHPLDLAVFREYIRLSPGGATTPLFNTVFDQLRRDIGMANDLPWYVRSATSKPIPLRWINDKNWIALANDYRRCFILEQQFRQFYIDYFIKSIGDRKKFYTECRCQRSDINDSFMDYVMLFDGKYLPVEVKLSVAAERNIVGQVSKYVYNSKVFLTLNESRPVTSEAFHPGKVLLIDTDKLYLFDKSTDTVDELCNLDRITSFRDLDMVKALIRKTL